MNTVIIVRFVAQNHEEFVALVKYLCSAYSTVTVSINHTVIISIIMIISVMIYRDINFLVSPIPTPYGAVFSFIMDDGQVRPIAYASHTLTAAEKNYSQLE